MQGDFDAMTVKRANTDGIVMPDTKYKSQTMFNNQ
jgi:hypothetical protein